MASKLVFNLARLRAFKLINRIGYNKYVVKKISNFQLKNAYFRNRIAFQDIKVPFLRLKVPNYWSNVKYVENRVIPRKLNLPNNLRNFKYLNKGCNGVICTIDDEKSLIAKQAYKFVPYCDKNYCDDSIHIEHSILDKLQCHPNIIQKVNATKISADICQDPEFVYSCPDVEHSGLTSTIILERMDMNLDELLRTEDLAVTDRIDILSQILEAQVYMNHRSICHRDMKLSNVLVKLAPPSSYLLYPRKYVIKVADFDCALDLTTPVDQATFSHQGANICTAPEILNMKKDHRLDIKELYSKNDIWAIGGMAYEIFGYENPFTKIDARSYSLCDLPPLGSVPDVIQQLVRSLLHPNSNLRYHSCVASDILQMFRLKLLIKDNIFNVIDRFSVAMMVGFCYLNHLYFTGSRFLGDQKRMEFVLNYVNK